MNCKTAVQLAVSQLSVSCQFSVTKQRKDLLGKRSLCILTTDFRYCTQTFLLLCSNIFVTVLRHFCYCAQTFLLLFSNIFVTVLKHFCYCAQTFLLLCSNIFVTVLKHFCYCAQIFFEICSVFCQLQLRTANVEDGASKIRTLSVQILVWAK